jgi:hypothetical protein
LPEIGGRVGQAHIRQVDVRAGRRAGGGIRAGRQEPLFAGGNAYLDREFPRLDRILRAAVIRSGAR